VSQDRVASPIARSAPGQAWRLGGFVLVAGLLPDPAVGAAFIVVGTLVPLVFARSTVERGRAYVAVIPALALGAVGYLVFSALATLTARV
jgi:hypothetical protein